MAPSPTPAARPARLNPLLLAALAAAALGVLLIHLQLTLTGPGLAYLTFDSAEYALAGRQLAETGRLGTPFIHAAALAKPLAPPFPLIAGHPLVPVLNAVVFTLTGPRPWATLVPSALAYVLAVLGCAVLARRLGSPGGVAVAAACTFMLSPWVLRFASEGLSELPFTALVTFALVLLVELPERSRPLLLGALLGLAHLTRPVLVPMLPAWIAGLALIAPSGRRIRSFALVLLGFAPFAALWLVYKKVMLGSAFADVGGYLLLASLTPEFAVTRLNRMVPPPAALPWILAHPGLLIRKLADALPREAYQIVHHLGRVIAALVAVRLAAPGDRRDLGLRITVLGSAALLLLLAALTVPDPRMAFPLLPAFIALAFDEARRLLEARGFRPGLVLVAGVLIVAVAGAPAIVREWRHAASGGETGRTGYREAEWRQLGEQLGRVLPQGGTVASDAAPWVAWYARRPVTLVPLGFAGLPALGRRVRLGALVITNEWLIGRPGEEEWRAAFEGSATPPGWSAAGRVLAGRLEAVVFLPVAAP
jgi:4-amino-4-deoxy-L-arabinose transferase-like glycosyltransferase